MGEEGKERDFKLIMVFFLMSHPFNREIEFGNKILFQNDQDILSVFGLFKM